VPRLGNCVAVVFAFDAQRPTLLSVDALLWLWVRLLMTVDAMTARDTTDKNV
jgi:hypothetical protein